MLDSLEQELRELRRSTKADSTLTSRRVGEILRIVLGPYEGLTQDEALSIMLTTRSVTS